MTRIENLLIDIRDSLADPNESRWSNDRLLRLINEAHKDMCMRAKILRDTTFVPIAIGTNTYTLQDNVYLIDKVVLNSTTLKLVTHSELDEKQPGWELDTGVPKYIVIDKMNRKKLRVYPTPSNYNNQEDATVIFNPSPYGITTSINNTNTLTPYGVVTSVVLENESTSFNSVYGVLTGQSLYLDTLVVYYIKKPDTIDSINSTLLIDSLFDKCIKFYVVGMALRDDMDTQNRTVGTEFLAYYDRDLNTLISDSTLDFTSTSTQQYETRYNGGFI